MASERALVQAIAALRAGERAAAHTLLQELTTAEPQRAEFWLWFAAASADDAEKRAHLLRAFALAPDDRRVVAGLRALGEAVPDPVEAVPAALPALDPVLPEGKPAPMPAAAVVPTKPLARTRFAATGVRHRRSIPWLAVALVCALVLLIPLTVWLI